MPQKIQKISPASGSAAMLQMVKLDIVALERAYGAEPAHR